MRLRPYWILLLHLARGMKFAIIWLALGVYSWTIFPELVGALLGLAGYYCWVMYRNLRATGIPMPFPDRNMEDLKLVFIFGGVILAGLWRLLYPGLRGFKAEIKRAIVLAEIAELAKEESSRPD